MEGIFILMRLPLYFIALLLYTWLGASFLIIAGFAWFTVVPILWATLALPFMLVMAAMDNDAKGFSDFIRESWEIWSESITEAPRKFFDGYRQMTQWLVKG